MAALYIRGIDDAIVRKVKAQAALEGQTISQYVIDLLDKATGGKPKPKK